MSDARVKGKHKALSLSQTLEIVSSAQRIIMSQIELSRQFSCSQSTISKISSRKDATYAGSRLTWLVEYPA